MNGDHVEPSDRTFFHGVEYTKTSTIKSFNEGRLIEDIECVVIAALAGFTIEEDYAKKILDKNRLSKESES